MFQMQRIEPNSDPGCPFRHQARQSLTSAS